MSNHPGLRLSLVGGLIVLLGVLLMVAVSDFVATFVMLIGGVGVLGGLMWTIFGFYSSPEGPASDH
jgi:hypothetical protein